MFQGVQLNPMTRKFLRIFMAGALCVGMSALAQTASPAAPSSTPLPAAPGVTSSSPAASSSTKLGTINIEQAVLACNEGRRDFDALQKKLEPKQTELKSQNDELESLQKQLQTQQDKLNPEALSNLQKQIESKKKSFDRAVQDAQEDAGNQQKEIFQRILQKMAPVIVKYAQENNIAMIVDISNPWPQSPVLWAGEGVDITRSVVEAYNTQSGVAAPAAAQPAAPKPATGHSPASKTPTSKSTQAPQ